MPTQTFLKLPKLKQERILMSALTLFNELGYDQVSVAALVKASRIPRGSFYMYFDDIEDVFRHLLNVIGEQKMAYMSHLTQRFSQEAFIHLYEDIVRAGIEFAKAHPAYYIFGLQLYRSHTQVMLRLRKELEDAGLQFMEHYLSQDLTQGYLKSGTDVTLLSRVLYRFNAHELLERFYEGESTEDLLALTKDMLTLLKNGIEGSR